MERLELIGAAFRTTKRLALFVLRDRRHEGRPKVIASGERDHSMRPGRVRSVREPTHQLPSRARELAEMAAKLRPRAFGSDAVCDPFRPIYEVARLQGFQLPLGTNSSATTVRP